MLREKKQKSYQRGNIKVTKAKTSPFMLSHVKTFCGTKQKKKKKKIQNIKPDVTSERWRLGHDNV